MIIGSSLGRQKERAMAKLKKKVDDKPGEDGNRPLVRPAARSAAAAILAEREQSDEGVRTAIVGLRRAEYEKSPSAL